MHDLDDDHSLLDLGSLNTRVFGGFPVLFASPPSAAKRVCERGRRPSVALDLFETMQREGVPTSVVTYNAVQPPTSP